MGKPLVSRESTEFRESLSVVRTIVADIAVEASPGDAFDALVTPSAIREWWSASRAIVIAEPDGIWAATWGEEEDTPDYVSSATIRTYDRPSALELGDYKYRTRDGALPFEGDISVRFTVEADGPGSTIRVRQEGFPDTADADDFMEECIQGWADTLAALKAYLEK